MADTVVSIEAMSDVIERARELARKEGGESSEPSPAAVGDSYHNPLQGVSPSDLQTMTLVFSTSVAGIEFLQHLYDFIRHVIKKPIFVRDRHGNRHELTPERAPTTEELKQIVDAPGQ
jgi:hypothetical protein